MQYVFNQIKNELPTKVARHLKFLSEQENVNVRSKIQETKKREKKPQIISAINISFLPRVLRRKCRTGERHCKTKKTPTEKTINVFVVIGAWGGVGGGLGEIAFIDIIITIIESWDDILAKKDCGKQTKKRKEENKERIGNELIGAANSLASKD